MEYPAEGVCQCGGLRFWLLEPPRLVVACHCRECQKLSSSAFSVTALVRAEAVRFRGAMAEWRRTADSGAINAAKFCPGCGNRIYHFNPERPEELKLKPMHLARPESMRPTVHIWVCRKQDWYTLPADVTTYQKQPD